VPCAGGFRGRRADDTAGRRPVWRGSAEFIRQPVDPMAASRPDWDRFRRLYILTESCPQDQNYSRAPVAGN